MGLQKAQHRKRTIVAALSDGAQCGATDCVGVCEWQNRKGLFWKCPFHLTNWVKCTAVLLLLKTHWCHILMWQQRAAQGNVTHIALMKRPKQFHLTFFWIIRFLKKGPIGQHQFQLVFILLSCWSLPYSMQKFKTRLNGHCPLSTKSPVARFWRQLSATYTCMMLIWGMSWSISCYRQQNVHDSTSRHKQGWRGTSIILNSNIRI